MNVLERERKKLEDRKQKNQDNIKANEKILTHLLKNKEDADIKLEIVKEKLQNLYNNKYTYINNDINILKCVWKTLIGGTANLVFEYR